MSKRGFASMSPEKQREIASKGGKSAHAQGKAHVFTSEEAKAAGYKGGRAVAEKYGSPHMARLGRIGGQAKATNRSEGEE